LYLPLYFYGFDSTASSREESITKYSRYYSLYLFRSQDCGRTWDFLSQISLNDRIFTKSMEGPCEAEMSVMPDGSVVILMRTGNLNPCYMARSTDNCQTWSPLEEFDICGVLPQVITLPCGVTITTYGRPMMRLRATDDPSGLEWGESVEVPLTNGWQSSCYYTDLLQLDSHTALWAYSDFQYPNSDGEPVKTILTRTITVVPKS
jgi:hypothetical protein